MTNAEVMAPNDASHSQPKPKITAVRRAALGSFIGTTIVWYDYFLYGTASAAIFPRVFFTDLTPTAATFASLGSFAVAWLLRPIGGLIFGHFGDVVSRKKMLLITLTMMGGATILIGALPSFAQIGLAAPVILICLRMIQGLALGGEWGGAALIVIEQAPDGKRGLYGAALQMGVPAGLLLSAGAVALVSGLPDQDFFSWGWRLPFLASIILLVIGYFLRRKLEDPKSFQKLHRLAVAPKLPVQEVLATMKVVTIKLAFVQFAANAGYYIFTVYSGVYAATKLHLPREWILHALIAAAAVDLCMQPVFAALSDRIGRRPVYIFGSLFIGIWTFPFFLLLESSSQPAIWLAMIGALGIGHAATGSINGPLYTEQYPTRMRYTGSSLAFQLSGVVTSTPAPLIAAWIVAATGSVTYVSVYIIGGALISTICALTLRETYKIDMDKDANCPSPT